MSMFDHKFDYSLKIVVVGDSGVGKTCFLLRFVRDQWEEKGTQPTLGVEFLTKVVESGGKEVQLQLWDTAGQELFRSVTRGYYRGSAGALIMFDLTQPDTFKNIPQWLQDIKNLARPDVVTVLVGNKSDIKEKRSVTREEAEKFAHDNNMQYFECSAMAGEGIQAAVQALISEIQKHVDAGTYQFDKVVNDEVDFRPKNKEGCSC